MGLLKHYSGVATEEDAEEWRLAELTKIFKGSDKFKDTVNYVAMQLRLTDFTTKEHEIKELNKEHIVCGFCNTKNDVLSAFPTSFTLRMYELATNILQQLNHHKITEKIEKKTVDEFEAFKQLKAWELTIKIGTEEVSGEVEIKCAGCEQLIGILQYRFTTQNVPKPATITWEQFDALPKPSSIILPRICRKMGVQIEDLDSYLSSEWAEKLKQKLQSWAEELKTFKELPEQIEYDMTQFLSLSSMEIEKEKQRRIAQWHEALLTVAKEELAYLAVT